MGRRPRSGRPRSARSGPRPSAVDPIRPPRRRSRSGPPVPAVGSSGPAYDELRELAGDRRRTSRRYGASHERDQARVRRAARIACRPCSGPVRARSRSPGSPCPGGRRWRSASPSELQLRLPIHRVRELPAQVVAELLAGGDVEHHREVRELEAHPQAGGAQQRAGLLVGVELEERLVEQLPELGRGAVPAARRLHRPHARWSLFAHSRRAPIGAVRQRSRDAPRVMWAIGGHPGWRGGRSGDRSACRAPAMVSVALGGSWRHPAAPRLQRRSSRA